MPGMKMIQLDTLSQCPDHRIDKSTGRKDQILLPDDLFVNLLDINLQEQILNAKDLDTDIKNIIEAIQKNGPTNLLRDITDWKIEEINRHKTIFYKEKNYVPRDQDLQHDIVKMFHDHKTAGHLGKLETYNLVKAHYWWPGMCMFIKKYKGAVTFNNSRSTTPQPTLLTNPLLELKTLAPWSTAPWT